jgi:hypothetical protein
MPMIEIWDGPAVRLSRLLDQVPSLDLEWAILAIWAVAREEDADQLALERMVEDSPSGVALSGQALRYLADMCVERNHLATGDEYEIVGWGVFGR